MFGRLLMIGLALALASGTASAGDVEAFLRPASPGKVDESKAAELKQLLDRHVREFLDNQPYAPLVWVLGKGGINYVFEQSSDTILALSMACPHLSPQLQPRVKAFLLKELETHPPYDKRLCFYDDAQGHRRENFAYSGQAGRKAPALEIGSLYGLWLLAENTGSYDAVQSHWVRIKPLIAAESVRKFKIDSAGGHWAMNQMISGLVGYIRLAERFGDSAAADAGKQALSSALDQLQAYWSQRQTSPGEKYFAGVATANGDVLTVFASQSKRPDAEHSATLACLSYLCGEETRFLAQEPMKKNVLQLLTAIDHVGPTWYVSGSERWIHRGGENAHDYPNESPGIMQAKSAIVAEPFERLQKYVDLPLCPGDSFYIQRLVTAIEASAK